MSSASRQELAEFGSRGDETELRGDDQLFRALVSGCHIENAAKAAGISERTAYRRLADPKFRKQIDDARESLRASILGKLADAGHDAISVLTGLMYESEDENIRLRAAKTILDSLMTTQRQGSQAQNRPASLSASVGSIAISVRKEAAGDVHILDRANQERIPVEIEPSAATL